MNLKHKACTMIFLLLSMSTYSHAANSPSSSKPPTSKAFYLDTSIWPQNTTTKIWYIPVCWEKISELAKSDRDLTRNILGSTWEAASLVRFYGWDGSRYLTEWGECPTGYFPGVRIRSNPDFYPGPNGTQIFTPFVKGLGKNILNLKDGVVLDFKLTKPTPLASYGLGDSISQLCSDNGFNLEACKKSMVVHEFGHVLGISHEQNRVYQIGDPLGLCSLSDPNPTPFNTFIIGNIKFSSYDNKSVMSYCNPNYPGLSTLSLIDTLAIKIYYDNMPSINYDRGYATVDIPQYVTPSGNKLGLIYTDTNKDGKFDLQSTKPPITSLTSANLTNANILNIPYLKETQNGKVVNLYLATMPPVIGTNNRSLTLTKRITISTQ